MDDPEIAGSRDRSRLDQLSPVEKIPVFVQLFLQIHGFELSPVAPYPVMTPGPGMNPMAGNPPAMTAGRDRPVPGNMYIGSVSPDPLILHPGMPGCRRSRTNNHRRHRFNAYIIVLSPGNLRKTQKEPGQQAKSQ
jgi:hypothetical protein